MTSFTLPVDPWIKFTATTVGRDKLYRTVQYTSKFLAFYMQQQDKDLTERLTKLSNAVGLARKLFRVGKPIDFIQTMLKSLAIKDDVIRICAMGRSAFLAGWLSLDVLQWLNAHGIVKFDQIKSINTHAARCWFIGLLFAVTADLYRLRNNMQRIEVLEKAKSTEDALKKELATLKKEQSKILLETVQDGLDLIIPGSILEYFKVDQGVVGLAGTITSLIGFQAAWPKS